MTGRAVALLSGGLDSALAILVVLRQNIRVKAIKFRTPFDTDISREGYLSSIARRFGFEVELLSHRERFLDIVRNPKHGYGKNMNPCIDCRIFMLREAGRIMEMTGADFIITGEVLGQRPMSQRKDMLYHIDREAGVTGLVLRPLSARLLRVTVPEQEGIIDREMLHRFGGRSRKPQMALAGEFGLENYPPPAGGCLLTEPNYAFRLKELLTLDATASLRDIDLLRTGRHFRASASCKIIIGRDERENEIIRSLALDGDCLLKVEGCGSPLTLVTGDSSGAHLLTAASLCARYSDAKNMSEVEVTAEKMGSTFTVRVSPAGEEMIEASRVERRRAGQVL